MPIYNYTAVGKDGRNKKGRLEATTKNAAINMIKDSGLMPMQVDEMSSLDKEIIIGNPVKVKDLVIFCKMFETILKAGVSIIEALDLMREQTQNKHLRKAIGEIYIQVEKGDSLANSMRAQKRFFPEILINMIQAGEMSGNLDTALERMSIHFVKENKLKQTVSKALAYPLIVSLVAVVVVGILVTVVVPTFVTMFADVGMELPASTKFLLALSGFFRNQWYIAVGIVVVITAFITIYGRQDEGKRLFSNIALKLPVYGLFTKKVVASRFSRTMSTLLASGLTILDSLEIVAGVVGSHVAKEALLKAREQVSKGMVLSKPLKEANLFPPILLHMVKIGENTGQLEEMLNRVADFYDEEVEDAVSQLTAMIEPLIIVVLAVVIGFIVISIVQPMFGMYEGISNY